MMRKSIVASVILLSVIAVIFLTKKTDASPPVFEGMIIAVDVQNHRIRVADDAMEYWFPCTDTTVITLNSNAATFAELKWGQHVKVTSDPLTGDTFRVDATLRVNGRRLTVTVS